MFNTETTISHELRFDSKVTVKILNITGREVSTIVKPMQFADTTQYNLLQMIFQAEFIFIFGQLNKIKFTATKK